MDQTAIWLFALLGGPISPSNTVHVEGEEEGHQGAYDTPYVILTLTRTLAPHS